MKSFIKYITLGIVSLLYVSCSSNIENEELEKVKLKLPDIKNDFFCSDVSANLGRTFNAEKKTSYNGITIELFICDSLSKNMDSAKSARLINLSKIAFNEVENKTLFGYYSINVFSDFERTNAVKILNYKYNTKTKDFEYYSSDRIP